MEDNRITRLELEAIIFTDYFEANRFFNSIEKPMSKDEFVENLKGLLSKDEGKMDD